VWYLLNEFSSPKNQKYIANKLKLEGTFKDMKVCRNDSTYFIKQKRNYTVICKYPIWVKNHRNVLLEILDIKMPTMVDSERLDYRSVLLFVFDFKFFMII
jgi:hypothetical protein